MPARLALQAGFNRYAARPAAAPSRPGWRAAWRARLMTADGNALFAFYLRATVPVWLLGILVPACLFVLFRLVWLRWPRGFFANAAALAWISIGLMQALCGLLYSLMIGDLAHGIRNFVSFGVIGWIFGGLAIAAGAAHRINGAAVIRGAAWLGAAMLAGTAVMLVGHNVLGLKEFYIENTPMALLLPKSKSVGFYTTAAFFLTEETFGESVGRMVLFYPWTTGLGLGGLTVTFIAALDRTLWWRAIGMGGGIGGVVFSWSRIALGTLVLVGAVLLFLRLPWRWRLVPIGAVLLVFMALPMAGIDPIEKVMSSQKAVASARAGSSLARDLIYRKSWEGFLASPYIGNGWIGASVHPKEELPIGSHSTIYGLLYTGGAPTLGAFIVAMLVTLAGLCQKLVRVRRGDPAFASTLAGLGLLLSLAMYAPYEALFSLTLPCLPLFVWLGASLAPPETARRAAAAWPETAPARPRTLLAMPR